MLGVGFCEWGDCVSTQKCECSCGGGDIFTLVAIVFFGLSATSSLHHIAEWHKRDGIQRGFAVVKPNEDGSGDVHVEWKPLDTKGAMK